MREFLKDNKYLPNISCFFNDLKSNYKIVLVLVIGLFLSSCAAKTAYYENLNSLVSGERYNEAVKLNENSKERIYGNKNALLYYLDRGMLLHINGDYEQSNVAFEKAKMIAEEHFTKSVTKEASTLLVSDNMRPYYGEDFERALINVFSALNYVFLGKESEALVEARQVDHFLKTLQTNYGHKNKYKEDAFARYLMGMIYENQKQYNDAYISYWKALEAYEQYKKDYGSNVPKNLVGDALRMANKLRLKDEIRTIQSKWGDTDNYSVPNDHGEIVVLNYNGLAPEKIDNFFEISFGKAWIYVDSVQPQGEEEEKVEQAKSIARSILSSEQIRLAFPKYVRSSYKIKTFKASLDGIQDKSYNDKSDVIEDIGSIAIKNLEDRLSRIQAKTIARAAIKFVLAKKISKSVEEKSNNETLGWLVKKTLTTAATATETADKRSWRSLPDEIQIARLSAPQGNQSINLNFYSGSGDLVNTKKIENINVQPGKKTFVVVRTAM